MAHAAWCRRRASNARRRTSRLRVRPAGRGAMTGAFGNALSASWLMELMTAQAIMSEKSMVLFCRFVLVRTETGPGILREAVSGFRSDSSGNRFVESLQTTLCSEGSHVSRCAAPWFS